MRQIKMAEMNVKIKSEFSFCEYATCIDTSIQHIYRADFHIGLY